MATYGGAADGYYNKNEGYNGAQQMQYPPQSYGNGNGETKYQQPPPNYGQSSQTGGDYKQDFSQVFKIERPRWNDLWAAILVRLAL